jgi:hypothetical protein
VKRGLPPCIQRFCFGDQDRRRQADRDGPPNPA